MKRNIKLWILIGVLVLCAAGYGIIAAVTKEESTDAASDEVTVTSFGADQVAWMGWNYEGKDFSLEKTDNMWLDESNHNFPVAQNYPAAMTAAVSNMKASRKLTDVADLSEYGLDEPQLTVSLMTDTSGELCFIFGNQNSVTGEYYMQYSQGRSFEANADVYLIPEQAVKAFSYSMDQLVQFEMIPDLSQINSVKINADEEYRLSFMGDNQVIPWVLRDAEGTKRGANTENCEDLAGFLRTLQFKRCVSYETGKADLSEYGLDDPWAAVTVDYTVQTGSANSEEEKKSDSFTFMLGDRSEEGEYYILAEGYKMLYTVDAAIAEWIQTNNIKDLTDPALMS